jgi:hypothetical protein
MPNWIARLFNRKVAPPIIASAAAQVSAGV